MIFYQEPLRGMLTLMRKKLEILGALAIAVKIIGAPYFRIFGSPKIRKMGVHHFFAKAPKIPNLEETVIIMALDTV